MSYNDSGYISDERAQDINYGELLDEMKDATITANIERANQGFGRVEL